MKTNYDIIVVGAGISGLGAALKLKEAGKNVLVLEKNDHVGGRMATDRFGEYVIDRGATIFGGRFRRMKALVKKLKLEHLAEDINFAFELQEKSKSTKIRHARIDDVFFHSKIGWRGKLALIRFGLSVLFRGSKLGHGNTTNALHLDDVCVEEYFRNMGGSEVLEYFLYPGLNGPMGGHLLKNSRLILFQTFWNILMMKTWAIKGGMDNIVDAMAKQLNVRTNSAVAAVTIIKDENKSVSSSEVENSRFSKAHISSAHVPVDFSTTLEVTGTSHCQTQLADGSILTSRHVIIALPGNIAAKLCGQIPENVLQLLRETKYGEMVSAHVMMNKSTETSCAAYGIAQDVDNGYEIELEHNRVKQLCPEGKGLASIYMWNTSEYRITEKSDEEIKARAEEIVSKHFPECANEIVDTHIIRWKEGIVHFTPGRLTKMSALRKEMKNWKLPIQLCGDYLDGIASESALVTGEEAAENLLRQKTGANT